MDHFVDERDFCKTPYYPWALPQKIYDGYKAMSLEEALNYPGLNAVTVEVPNNDLVPIALQCAERGIAMHMDKPGSPDLEAYKKLLDGWMPVLFSKHGIYLQGGGTLGENQYMYGVDHGVRI